ncbi:unnamed protein product [Arctia plantaginis]|uniref:Uncharacterized protein n=1 Tax=Arctia plantaginis TaxID=874455 RepID=A0A8S1A3Y1_ARCPL|nr:unnamed protein product [Arctia plantaginis]
MKIKLSLHESPGTAGSETKPVPEDTEFRFQKVTNHVNRVQNRLFQFNYVRVERKAQGKFRLSNENFFREVGGSASRRLTTLAARSAARGRLASDVKTQLCAIEASASRRQCVCVQQTCEFLYHCKVNDTWIDSWEFTLSV